MKLIRLTLVALVLSPLVLLAAPATITPDDTARFLAGLAVRDDSGLAKLAEGAAWKQHATFFNDAWSKLEKRQLQPIRSWIPGHVKSSGPMFYMFSGPDFLYASTFFPNAPLYVLAGLEPVGPLPDVTKLDDKLPDALANLRKSLDAVLSWSFFKTKDMKVDLQQTQLNGTLPVLYVFLARQGCRIQSVEFVTIDKEGKVVAAEPGAMGARITFSRSGATQTLYYFSTNLADGEIKPRFLTFLTSLGDGVSLLKAASYLMHYEGFSTIRKYLLAHSKVLVQDDSGIPLKHFDRQHWGLEFHGVYTAPTPLFKEHFQADLLEVYRSGNPAPLSFGFGYQWRPKASNLMVAQRSN